MTALLDATDVLLRFSDVESEPEILAGERDSSGSEFNKLRTEERDRIWEEQEWALYNISHENCAGQIISRISESVREIRSLFSNLELKVDDYERVVRDIDGDLKNKISEFGQLQTLLHYYDLEDSEYYSAFSSDSCAAVIALVNRDGVQNVIGIFPQLDDAIGALARGAVVPHPEQVEKLKDYTFTRLQGLKMLSDTAERTMETIMTKLSRQLVSYQHDAQAIVSRQYRDSQSIIKAATFLPTPIAHIKFRVMGRSIKPITTMLKERAVQNEVGDYLHHLNRLWLSYTSKRLRLIESAFSKQLNFIMQKPNQTKAASLREACLYWLDYAHNERDSFYFYFPEARWTNPDKILQTIGANLYDVVRSHVISVHDVANLRALSDEMHNLIDHLNGGKLDEGVAKEILLSPMEAMRRDIKNKLVSRIHEIFIRNISATYLLEEPSPSSDLCSQQDSPKQLEPVTNVRSLAEMIQLISDPKIGRNLHLPVVTSALNSLEKIDTILDTTVINLLSEEISDAVNSKLSEAVITVAKLTKKKLNGSLFACRELLCLHNKLGPSLLQSTDTTNKLVPQLSHWLSQTVAEAQAEIISAKNLEVAFREYLESVAEYILSIKYDPFANLEKGGENSTNNDATTNLFVTPVYHALLKYAAKLREGENAVAEWKGILDERLDHWRHALGQL